MIRFYGSILSIILQIILIGTAAMVGSRSFINLSLCLDSNHWFPARNAGCLHGYRSWQFQLHTQYVKKLGS
jgi:hypothetical protein